MVQTTEASREWQVGEIFNIQRGVNVLNPACPAATVWTQIRLFLQNEFNQS